MTPVHPEPEPVVPPEVVDPPPGGTQPVIPDPDPTHTPVIPDPDPTEPASSESIDLRDREAIRPIEPTPSSAVHVEREVDDSWPVIGAGLATGPMVKGSVRWGSIGALIGVALGAVFALIPFAGLGYAARFAILGACFALAGATGGGLYGGARESELEDDVGNQIGPPPLLDKNVDPPSVRHERARS